MEPRYTSADPFEEEDNAWRYYDDLNEEWHSLIELAMQVTGRTSYTFRKPAEKSKWKTIIGQLDKNMVKPEWVYHCIRYAEKKNSGHSRGVPYTFETLTKYIQNKAAMTDWLAENPEQARTYL